MTMATQGLVVWFTGLPCSGKTTLSDHLNELLSGYDMNVHQLDGDRVRSTLNSKLGYTKEDRIQNVRAVVFEAARLAREGSLVLVSLIAPYQVMRDHARAVLDRYIEVYVKCPLSVCEARDVKGMYRLARSGKISLFTGLSDPYEIPSHPDVIVETDRSSIGQCCRAVLRHITPYLAQKPSVDFSHSPR